MSGTNSLAFVRSQMLPAEPPPANETGAVKWLRENLLSSWLNIALTVLAIYVIYWALAHTMPWALRGIWNANSLAECRQIRDQLYGPGSSAACWAVIPNRWEQLLYGFYPAGQRWRVNLSLVLVLVALAPILFSSLPRKMMWFSLAVPILVFWLLWGGSLWWPLSVAFGAVIGAFAFIQGAKISRLAAICAAILLTLLYWIYLTGAVAGFVHRIIPIGLDVVPSRLFGGFMLSFIIGLAGITLSLPLGILLALGRQSSMPIVRMISVSFIEVIRGVPLVVWLFTASLLLNYFLPPGTNFDLTLRVIIMVTLFASAYIAEVVRGGLAALPRGQYEAADSLGLDYWLAMRLIILPQALKISIPGIVNTFIGMFKDTTLVVFIGLLDPIGISNSIRATTDWNGIYWELFIFIGVLFFICCYAMSRYSQYLERKLQRGHR